MRILKRLFRIFRKKALGRPVFDGKVRAYPTLRCNLNCEYCVNTYVDGGRHLNKYSILQPSQWIDIFNKLNRDIVITGGEPFLYPGLAALVQGVNPRLKIRIYSNLMVPLKGDLAWLRRRGLSIYGSFHSSGGNDDIFTDNIRLLKKQGVTFSIHAINVQGKEKLKAVCAEKLGTDVPRIVIDEDQRDMFACSSKQFRKRALCERAHILIAPDGNRYQCVSRMVRRVAPFENLLSEPMTTIRRAVKCPDYGYCAPCDGLGETKQVVINE